MIFTPVIYIPGSSYDPVLENNSWEAIAEAASRGRASSLWQVGDCKSITLNGTVGALTLDNYTTYAFILGFDHNADREGNNCIHFQLAKTALTDGTEICFVDSNYNSNGTTTGFRMNTSATNTGGWASSYMRNVICGITKDSTSGTLMGAIPSELRDVLKSVTKYTDNTGGGAGNVQANVTATTDYIFLLSETEVSGTVTNSNLYEASYQQTYTYYIENTSRRKYQHTDTATTARWWTRSSLRSDGGYFVAITVSGSSGNSQAYASLGVAPCFCV